MESLKDFTPTKEQISLHGLGFIQIALPANKRLHVWHPDLPRRSCYAYSAVHNHRFSFRSTVLIGTQVNQRFRVATSSDGRYDIISHDGPRSEKGGRLSYVAGHADLFRDAGHETYGPGESYEMAMLEYHETPNSGIVVTIMEKLEEGTVHANSIITRGITFDQTFDRFQLSQDRLWDIFVEAMKS